MPRSWQSPRRRRILVPAIMWLVLAGAVSLAALVARHRNLSQHVDLATQITIDSITASLPAHWIISTDTDNLGVVVHEPGDSDQQRLLVIRLYPTSPNITADQFLTASGLFREPVIPPNDDPEQPLPQISQAPQPITIAGFPGILKKALRFYALNPRQTDALTHEELIAAAILPNHQAVLLRLYCPPENDEDNTTLIRRLASAISLTK